MYLVAVLILCSLPARAPLFGQTGPDYKVYAVEYASIPNGFHGNALGCRGARGCRRLLMVWPIRSGWAEHPGGHGLPPQPSATFPPRHESGTFVRTRSLPIGVGQRTSRTSSLPTCIGITPTGSVCFRMRIFGFTRPSWSITPQVLGRRAETTEASTRVMSRSSWNSTRQVGHVCGRRDQGDIPGNPGILGWAPWYASQYLGFTTPDGTVILASDNVWFYANQEKNLANSLTFDPEAQLKAQDRMRLLASKPDWIIPGHDGAVFEKFPNPVEGVARIR